MNKALERSVNLVPWGMRRRIKDVPLVAPLQRWLFGRFLSGREFLHTIDAGPAKGLVYPISLPVDKPIWTGAYELELADVLSHSVKNGDVCYDVGAYRGFFSGVFGLAGASNVIAFEPFPKNCDQLNRLAFHNPGLPLKVENIAIGRGNGSVEFTVMPDSSMGKLATSSFQSDVCGTSVIRVPLRTLDSLVDSGRYPPPDILKIDVEGAEVDVLEGATEILRIKRPILFIEAHSRSLAESCVEILDRLDYQLSFLGAGVTLTSMAPTDVCHLMARA